VNIQEKSLGSLAGILYLGEHDPEKPAPDLIRGVKRFSEKIMLKDETIRT
jgi:hypothetical protein